MIQYVIAESTVGEQKTTSAISRNAETSQEEAQERTVERVQAGQSPERRTWWLRKAAQRIGWIQKDEPPAGEEHQSLQSTATTSQSDVSQITVVALSADGELISASNHLRLRVDPNNLQGIVGLLKGKRALATWDIVALLRDEILAKVLVPQLACHQAASLRANRNLLTELETETRSALANTLHAFGLLLENFAISWGFTEQERMAVARKRAEREEQVLEFANSRRVAHLRRLHEIEKTRLANLQLLKTAQATGNEELKALLLASELKRNLLIKNQKVDFAQVDAQVRGIALGAEKLEAQARLEQRRAAEELRLDVQDREFKQKHAARLAALEASDKEMWSMVRMQIELANQKHERELAQRRQEIDAEFRRMQAEIDNRYQQRKLKLEESLARMGMIERLVSQGLGTGHADASVLNTMLQQATEQEYATTSDAMVQARSAAQVAADSLKTYQEAQADERRHQGAMTSLASGMMEAAKQPPPPVVVSAAGIPPIQPIAGQPVALSNAPPPPNVPNLSCPSCQRGVEVGMKFCPFCGKSLD